MKTVMQICPAFFSPLGNFHIEFILARFIIKKHPQNNLWIQLGRIRDQVEYKRSITEPFQAANFGAIPATCPGMEPEVQLSFRIDPDIWVVEIEDREGRHFLIEPVEQG